MTSRFDLTAGQSSSLNWKDVHFLFASHNRWKHTEIPILFSQILFMNAYASEHEWKP